METQNLPDGDSIFVKEIRKKGIHSMKDSGYVLKKTGSSTNVIIQVNVTTTLEMSWVFA